MNNNSRKGIKDKNHLENLDKVKLQELIDSNKEYSYAKFIPMIGLERLRGNAKESQMKKLETICKYKKIGTKYKFLRMRRNDEIVVYNNKEKYLTFIGTIMVQIVLDKQKKNECDNGLYYMTTPQMLLELGMVNQNFSCFHNNKHKWAYKKIVQEKHPDDFSMFEINIFMSNVYAKILQPIIRDSLKVLGDKYGVSVQKAYKCYKHKDNGFIEYSNHLADGKVGEQIEEIINKSLESVGIKSIDRIYVSKPETIRKYYESCNEMCKDILGYDGFCQCYAFSIDKEVNNGGYNWSKEAIRHELNKRVIERIESAKMLYMLRIKSRNNLVDAVISLDTRYDFDSEYRTEIKRLRKEGILK